MNVIRNFSRVRSISNSFVVGEERLDRLERAGKQVLPDLPDVRVLDDQVAADGHEPRVLGELGLDVRLRVVGVQDHQRPLPLGARTDLGDDVGVGRGAAAEIRDPRVCRVVVPRRLDVDRDDLACTEQVAERGEEERAAAAVRAGLDHELGPGLDQ